VRPAEHPRDCSCAIRIGPGRVTDREGVDPPSLLGDAAREQGAVAARSEAQHQVGSRVHAPSERAQRCSQRGRRGRGADGEPVRDRPVARPAPSRAVQVYDRRAVLDPRGLEELAISDHEVQQHELRDELVCDGGSDAGQRVRRQPPRCLRPPAVQAAAAQNPSSSRAMDGSATARCSSSLDAIPWAPIGRPQQTPPGPIRPPTTTSPIDDAGSHAPETGPSSRSGP
jgi:hypothetical protein